MTAPLPDNEAARLEALRQCCVLDTEPEDAYDDITHLAAQVCGVPIAAVSLVDADRQWLKSITGLCATETPRDISFCAHTILQPEMMIIPDTHQDALFASHPLVIGAPYIRFYAGMPLITSDGFPIGSLCVIDLVPRQLTSDQERALRLLARQASSQLEAKRQLALQEQIAAERVQAEEALRRSEARLKEAQAVAQIGSWEYSLVSGRIMVSEELLRLFEWEEAWGEPSVATLMQHYHPDDLPMQHEISQQAMQDGRPYEYDIRILRPGGGIRWCHAVGRGERDATGAVVRLYGTLMDISERKQAELALAQQQRFQHGLLESLQEGIVACDANGTLTLFNRASREFHGIPEQPLPPEEWAAQFDLYAADGVTPLRTEEIPLFRALHGEVVREAEMIIAPHSGLPRVLLASGQAITDADGTRLGAVVAMHDITHRRQAENAVRHSEARLAEAQSIARIGSWEYDVLTGELLWSDEMYRLFSFDPMMGAPKLEEVTARYHPEDRERRNKIFADALATGQPYEVDLRVILPSGETRWFHAVGRPIRGDTGATTRVVGTTMDITERALGEERFRVLFECSSDAHLLFDEDGIIDCNNAAVAMLGCTDKAEMLACHPASFSPEQQPDGRLSMEKCREMDQIARERGSHRFEWVHQKANGTLFPVEVTLTPVTLNNRPCLLVVWHDLTERKAAEQVVKDYAVVLEFQKTQLETANTELEMLATTDGLSGLKNHRAFQERLAEEVSRAQRYQTPLSLVLLDVDHFKAYNDTFGHPEGDVVLRKVARILQTYARGIDLAARYGGEEFVLILPQTNRCGAATLAERIRAAIANTFWPLRPITASFGVATLDLSMDSGSDLVAEADAALYRSKAAGRNQVSDIHTCSS